MLVKNTKEKRMVRDAVASMAIEGMHYDENFITELLKVDNGEKSPEEPRQEVIRKYERKKNDEI